MFLDSNNSLNFSPSNFSPSNRSLQIQFTTSRTPLSNMPAFEVEEEELKKAAQALCSRISALLEEEDRKQLRLLNEALLRGDLTSFERVCRSEQHNIGRLKAFIETTDKNLVRCQSGLRVLFCNDGTVLLHRYHGGAGLKIFLSEAPAELRPIETDWTGKVSVTEGEVIGLEPEDLLAEISMMAVKRIMNTLTADPSGNTDDLPTVFEIGEPD